MWLRTFIILCLYIYFMLAEQLFVSNHHDDHSNTISKRRKLNSAQDSGEAQEIKHCLNRVRKTEIPLNIKRINYLECVEPMCNQVNVEDEAKTPTVIINGVVKEAIQCLQQSLNRRATRNCIKHICKLARTKHHEENAKRGHRDRIVKKHRMEESTTLTTPIEEKTNAEEIKPEEDKPKSTLTTSSKSTMPIDDETNTDEIKQKSDTSTTEGKKSEKDKLKTTKAKSEEVKSKSTLTTSTTVPTTTHKIRRPNVTTFYDCKAIHNFPLTIVVVFLSFKI